MRERILFASLQHEICLYTSIYHNRCLVAGMYTSLDFLWVFTQVLIIILLRYNSLQFDIPGQWSMYWLVKNIPFEMLLICYQWYRHVFLVDWYTTIVSVSRMVRHAFNYYIVWDVYNLFYVCVQIKPMYLLLFVLV